MWDRLGFILFLWNGYCCYENDTWKLNLRVHKRYYTIFPIIHLESLRDLSHQLKLLICQSVVLKNFSEYFSVPWWICSSKKNCSRKWFTFHRETNFWETDLAPIKLRLIKRELDLCLFWRKLKRTCCFYLKEKDVEDNKNCGELWHPYYLTR